MNTTKLSSKVGIAFVLLNSACGLFGAKDEAETKNAGLSNVSVMPCAMAGGSCRAASDCSRGVGSIGSDKYSCGGSRRICCFDACGAEAETVECCNTDHSYAPRPTCTDGKLSCAAGTTKVPIGTCVPKG
jgi:hypothetical protein